MQHTCSLSSTPLAARHSTTSTKRSGSFSGDNRTQHVSSVRSGATPLQLARPGSVPRGRAPPGNGILARSILSAGSSTCCVLNEAQPIKGLTVSRNATNSSCGLGSSGKADRTRGLSAGPPGHARCSRL